MNTESPYLINFIEKLLAAAYKEADKNKLKSESWYLHKPISEQKSKRSKRMKNLSFYQNQRILLRDGSIANGEYLTGNENETDKVLIRIKDGYLNDAESEKGEILPAVFFMDGTHIEHWKNGVLHSDNEPAVIDTIDDYEEWWKNGKKIEKENENG